MDIPTNTECRKHWILFVDDIFIVCDSSVSYRIIAHELGKELSKQFNVKVLDCGYKGGYHELPFSLIQGYYHYLPAQILYLQGIVETEHVIFIFDLIKHTKLARAQRDRKWRYNAIFPIESWPLLPSWAEDAQEIDRKFVISKFGKEVCDKAGLETTYLPLGLDIDFWQPGDKDIARGQCCELWISATCIRPPDFIESLSRVVHSKVIFTIADNQERKNLSACFQIFSQLKDNSNVLLVICAPPKDQGWDLFELAKDYQCENRFVWVGDLSKQALKNHYQAADVLLLPSQAEGYAIPLREAVACGTPWVATDCTAISEAEGGVLIEPVMETIYPLGNHRRYWIDTKKAAQAIDGIFNGESPDMNVKFSTWGESIEVLIG